MERFRLVPTAWGWFTLVLRGHQLVATRLPEPAEDACLGYVAQTFPNAEHDPRLAPELCRAVRRYFQGYVGRFQVTLDLAGATPFQRAVINACRRIPPGRTRAYGELAALAGRPGAARAVGAVMARNRHPLIVPCHRVVAAGGKLGGWSGDGGLDQKAALLAWEAER